MRILIAVLLVLATMVLFSCSNDKNEPADETKVFQIKSTFISQEKAKLLDAMNRASQSGNHVLIKVGAAWCAPCRSLDDDIAANQAEFEKITSRFEFITYEHLHWHALSGTMDFMPSYDVAFFPSLFIYNVNSKQWSYFGTTNIKELKTEIENYLATGSTSSLYLEKSQDLLAKVEADPSSASFDFADAWDNTDILFQAALRTAYEKTGAEALPTLKRINQFTENAGFKGQAKNFLLGVVQKGLQILVARGEMEADQALALIKEDDIEGKYRVAFTAKLGSLLRRQFPAEGRICNRLRDELITDYSESAEKSAKSYIAKSEAKIARFKAELFDPKNKDNTALLKRIEKKIESEKQTIIYYQQFWGSLKLKSQIVCHLVSALRKKGDVSEKLNVTLEEVRNSGLQEKTKNRLFNDISYAFAASAQFSTAIELATSRIEVEKKKKAEDEKEWKETVRNYDIEIVSLETELKRLKAGDSADPVKIKELEDKIAKAYKMKGLYQNAIDDNAVMGQRIEDALTSLIETWQSGAIDVKK